ncbi:OmpA family protein [Ponticoccus sp. (in: a-proteobacteria)]|uniref:OmpA family protein n=1 Tax=Ponticoccus sp. (in: a-proteobacteria) TaxID=1925025 RepID=UPI003AB7C663
MKTNIATKLSASVLALTIGTGAAAQENALEQFVQACEQGAELPGTLTCELVGQAQSNPQLMGQVMSAANSQAPVEAQEAPAGEPAEPAEAAEPAAPAEPAEAGEPVDAAEPADAAPEEPVDTAEPAEEAPEEPVDSAEPAAEAPEEPVDTAEPAEDAPEEPVDTAEPAEDAPEEPVVTAEPAEEAPEEPVETAEPTDAASEEPVETADPAADASEAEVDTAEPAQDGLAEEPVETAEEPVAEPDPQAQADAIAEQDAAPAAAAAADGDAEAERVEETVEADEVRRSDEDFETSVDAAPAAPAAREDDDDDDEMDDAERLRRTLGTAAAVGLGAVVLNEILESNDNVVSNSGDRVVVERDGRYRVLRNDDVLLRRPGANVETYRYNDGSTRAVVSYEDGSTVETVRAADGRVLRRVRTLQDGSEVLLFDDTQEVRQVVVNDLPQVDRDNRVTYRQSDSDALARALAAQETQPVDRTFSLNQVRNIDQVRYLVPEISVDSVNFQTGSAAIRPEEAEELSALGNALRDAIRKNPSEVFLIEGHTDAVGGYAYNLALSDRRAESVALALTEYFQVPPENMVLQGYGEGDLLVNTQEAEQANRRVAVRRITSLLQSNSASRD